MEKGNTNKRGNILISDVIFLILTLAFAAILVVFIARQSSSAALLEQKTAKELALAIDASSKGDQMTLNMNDVIKKNQGIKEPIEINNQGHYVRVKLSEKSGYSYGFFNDVNIGSEINGGYLTLKVE